MSDRTHATEGNESTAPDLSRVTDIVEIDNRYYVLASSSLGDQNEGVLKHDESFAVFDQYGDIRPVGQSEEGVYHRGTRHLSGLLLRIEGERPLLLGSTAKRDNSRLSIDLTNPDMMVEGGPLGHGSVHVARSKVLWASACYERITLHSFERSTLSLRLSLFFSADFADIFEVRGMYRRHHGTSAATRVDERSVTHAYRGLDGVERRTRVTFDRAPTRLDEEIAAFDLRLRPGRSVTIDVSIGCEVGRRRSRPIGFDAALALASRRQRQTEEGGAHVTTSSDLCNEWLHRSLADMVMMTSETKHGPYPHAGVPWFSTVFGRDGIIAARQTMWVLPQLANGVLAFLAATQAKEDEPDRDAQPGKILHEMRHGEMAATGEIPFARYYGSHDATPLFIWLAAQYHRRTNDLELVESLWDNIELGLAWMDGPGDADGDGFLEYARTRPDGLVQQGWKDSNDSILHQDGSLARGPIATCEIQGYAYAARVGAAELAAALDRPARAAELRAQAQQLRERFDEAFWLDDLETYALALDGDKQPCRVRTSNVGHCLATGIVPPERAPLVAATLLSAASYSGWGVRTLAAGEARYNPMSYHNGSIWPHDNAIVALGLARYGFRDHAARILTGIFDASRHFDLARLPELFCGFTRRDAEGPTRYPVACSPQAWAAGAAFMLLEACLGLDIDATEHVIRFNHARLPLFLDRLRIDNLAVGAARVDLQLERQLDGVGVDVVQRRGQVEVVAVR